MRRHLRYPIPMDDYCHPEFSADPQYSSGRERAPCFLRGSQLDCLNAGGGASELFGRAILKNWGPYTVIVAIAVLGEVIFSIFQKNGSNFLRDSGVSSSASSRNPAK